MISNLSGPGISAAPCTSGTLADWPVEELQPVNIDNAIGKIRGIKCIFIDILALFHSTSPTMTNCQVKGGEK